MVLDVHIMKLDIDSHGSDVVGIIKAPESDVSWILVCLIVSEPDGTGSGSEVTPEEMSIRLTLAMHAIKSRLNIEFSARKIEVTAFHNHKLKGLGGLNNRGPPSVITPGIIRLDISHFKGYSSRVDGSVGNSP
jgi:hypothetical protein